MALSPSFLRAHILEKFKEQEQALKEQNQQQRNTNEAILIALG
jgi:hypothetical protein